MSDDDERAFREAMHGVRPLPPREPAALPPRPRPEALRQFIAESVANGDGCVRVIHGKGRGSGQRGPVLEHVVNHRLRRMDDVLAFASARPVDGGTGAALVLPASDRRSRTPSPGPTR